MGVKTRVVSFSELDSLRQCRMKHRLGYLERWKPASEAETLSRGRLFHEIMEAHYLRVKESEGFGVDAAALYAHVGPHLYDSHTGRQSDQQALVEWMYRGYVDHYKLDYDWEIVAVEHPFEVWLPTSIGRRSSFRFKGKIDVVVRDSSTGGGLWLVDHKTCKNLPKGKELDLDDQFALYLWGMRERGNDVRGVIYNAVRTERLKTREMAPKERFKREYTVRTQTELDTIAKEAYEQFAEAYRGVTQIDSEDVSTMGVDEGSIGGRRDPARSPNTDSCRWRCPFTEPCLAGRKGADMRRMMAEIGFKQDFQRH